MQHEVVEHDNAGTAAQRVDDPSVRVGVVPDVVQRDIGGNRTRPASACDFDIDEPFENRQEKRAVIGDAAALGRQR